jgi:phosphoribosylglycinamide formyltransferase-1
MGSIDARIVTVVVNNPEAPMIQKARDFGLNVMVIPHAGMIKAAHEAEIIKQLLYVDFDLVCLAGYMRILSADFIQALDKPIINIHPSLLPSFRGLHAQQQAFDFGVKVTGCTVHLVNEELDAGKILDQRCVRIEKGDTAETLAGRILEVEHELYPDVIGRIASGSIQL